MSRFKNIGAKILGMTILGFFLYIAVGATYRVFVPEFDRSSLGYTILMWIVMYIALKKYFVLFFYEAWKKDFTN